MYNNLGIITPDITRELGFISEEAVRSLGIITPDITRELGESPLVMGAPIATWASVMAFSGLGAGAATFAATRSGKGAVVGLLGGVLGGAAGVALATFLNKRAIDRLVSSVQSA